MDYGSIKPFNDTLKEHKPADTAPESGSINTAEYDRFRQGIEVVTERHKAAVTYRVYSGRDDHVLETVNFGQTSPRLTGSVTFSDAERWTAGQYILIDHLPQTSRDFPFAVYDSDVDARNWDGVIEPLDIRAPATLDTSFFPVDPRAIRGQVMGGGGVTANSSQLVSQFYQKRTTARIDRYVDDGYDFGNRTAYAYIDTTDSAEEPFNDTVSRTCDTFFTSSLVKNYASNSASVDSSDYINKKSFSSTCGFVFDNSIRGIDSIGYGGMIYKVAYEASSSIAVAASFSPTDIAGLYGWYDASVLSSLYQDSGRTTPVAVDGDPVGAWSDRSGNNRHLTAAGGVRPTYKSSGTYIQFDGVDDTVSALMALGNCTIVAVLKVNDAGYGVAWDLEESATSFMFTVKPDSHTLGIYRGATSAAASNASAYSTGTKNCYAWRTNTSSPYYEMYRDQTSQVTITATNPGSGTVNGTMYIASYQGASIYLKADYYEIVIYNSHLSDSDLLLVEAYLQSKWGTP